MTNEDKAELRWEVRNRPDRSDAEIARIVCCHVSTVRNYRKVFGKADAKADAIIAALRPTDTGSQQ
jgi:hypothetical protein